MDVLLARTHITPQHNLHCCVQHLRTAVCCLLLHLQSANDALAQEKERMDVLLAY